MADLAALLESIKSALGGAVTGATMARGELTIEVGRKAATNGDEIGAASVDYLFYSGYVALAYWWARSVATVDAGGHPDELRTAKRATARFYFARILPRIHGHAAAMRSGAAVLQGLDAALFDS